MSNVNQMRREKLTDIKYLEASAEETEAKAIQIEEEFKTEEILRYKLLNEKLIKSYYVSISLPGSFQCQVKISPAVTILVIHLIKQGFHVSVVLVVSGMSDPVLLYPN